VSPLRVLVRTLAAVAMPLLCAVAPGAHADTPSIVMASTTSTEQSGLFPHLLPAFTAATGIEVRVVALGTGQALDAARRGDADVVFVHDRAAEEKFVAEGYGLKRQEVMYNDFVLVRAIRESHASFVSRGDNSGTHAAELRLWKGIGVDAPAQGDANYKACGCGMGPALNIAASDGAYLLADRGTWLAFRNRGELEILVEADARLFNQYGVIVVNPAKHPHVKVELAQKFADWIVSPQGQAAIAAYRIDGQQLFFPNAH
jgi:tungstate transport system substrate-binding protein